jgi:hypothetical protein
MAGQVLDRSEQLLGERVEPVRERLEEASPRFAVSARCSIVVRSERVSTAARPPSSGSLLRAPPPTRCAASRMVVVTPARASVTAAASPLGPEPTTTAFVMVCQGRATGRG